jgi:hypothetical protein
MGVGPIPYSKVRQYADRHRHNVGDEDQFLRLWSIVRAVDSEDLRLNAEASKPEKKKDDETRRKAPVAKRQSKKE